MNSIVLKAILVAYALSSINCFKLMDKDDIESNKLANMTLEELLKICGPFITNPEYGPGGDIMQQDPRSRKAINSASSLWASKILRFSFDPKIVILDGPAHLPNSSALVISKNGRWATLARVMAGVGSALKTMIQNAMSDYQTNTCLRFTDVTALPSGNYARFVRLDGCTSFVGMIGGRQDISLGTGCDRYGIVAHEIGHALGLYHEQSRPDRVRFVRIMSNNLLPGQGINFRVERTNNYGIPYDYSSIMHYRYDTFSNRMFERNTVVPKRIAFTYKIGQRQQISFSDYKILNLMYECNQNCSLKNCGNNGGYVGPSCQCVCPPGFSGANCETGRAPRNFTCGRPIRATTIGQTFNIQTPNYPSRSGGELCAWDIRGPSGSKIQVQFTDFYISPRYTGNIDPRFYQKCVYEWVELRTRNMFVGPFFCGRDLNGQTRTSRRNRMSILVNPMNSSFGRGFSATVSVVPA